MATDVLDTLIFTNIGWLTIAYDSKSREFNTSFWLPWALQVIHDRQVDLYARIHKDKN